MPHKKHTEKQEEEKDIVSATSSEEPTQETIETKTESEWETKANEYLNDLKRLQAEFENYKKRQDAQQKELRGILIEKLVLDIVPVLDNFRTATEHVPEAERESPWVTGIRYIEKQLETVLTDNGLSTIEAKEDDIFDPNIHEAVSDESDGSDEKHSIAKVVQKGYRFGERIIRPAKVIVK